MRKDKFVVGLTGGIGTGKSTAADLFRKWGCVVFDADSISKQLTKKGEPALAKIISEFGEELIKEDGELDRPALAKIVFNDKNSLIVLQSILADALELDIKQKIAALSDEECKPFVVLEAPVLYEYGAEYLVDYVLIISADEESQIDRVMKRNDVSREDVKRRINSQLPQSEKLGRADLIVENTGSMEEFEAKLWVVYEKIKVLASKR